MLQDTLRTKKRTCKIINEQLHIIAYYLQLLGSVRAIPSLGMFQQVTGALKSVEPNDRNQFGDASVNEGCRHGNQGKIPITGPHPMVLQPGQRHHHNLNLDIFETRSNRSNFPFPSSELEMFDRREGF